ncbi:allophanate hydrolase [Clavibacter michiganensis]|uniref:Allophanate hydrolase n=1 Tax=Clavibacter michiganensis TaxID=28447 RepID=A0A2S5VWN7_9MICO|nr:biotin-dependent carboxyltransferase family protein [Clavibacter michiganensis]PPF70025.1 allophanate hydrolase [Clavibacter michiganensis]
MTGPEAARRGRRAAAASAPALVVERTGPLMLVQDAGRPGHGGIGVSPSGALDPRALADANLLVGNDAGTAGLEIVLGGAVLRATAAVWVAVTGAVGPLVRTVGRRARPAPYAAAMLLDAGDALEIGPAVAGIRWYLAVRGGIDAAPVLGSRATDLLSRVGPAAVAAGDVLPVGPPPARPVPPVDSLAVTAPADGEVVLRVSAGPRLDWFVDGAWAALLDRPWEVTAEADRVGVRLAGEPLVRRIPGELPSEGVVTGALQVPPSGQPILFLADHPMTGGYPVIGVVARDDVRLAAQLRPGQRVRLV